MVYGTYMHVLPSPASALCAIKTTDFTRITRDYRRSIKRRSANNIFTCNNLFTKYEVHPLSPYYRKAYRFHPPHL